MIRRPAAILALLTGLNLLNYLDRLVISAVLPRIQADLALSNFVGGLLATVFLVGYFVTAPVFGALGDRMPRKRLIAFGIAVWSVATCASGLATTATQLIIARAFVGIGEASYATLAPTLIDDIVAPERKGRALAYFYGATPFGAALGYFVGGYVEARWGWRTAFFVAGGPGLVLAIVCLLVAEPVRSATAIKPKLARDLSVLMHARLYRKAIAGYCAYTAAIGAFSFWAPKFLVARYGLSLKVANFKFGIILIAAGVLATLAGGAWADRMRRRILATSLSSSDLSQRSASHRTGSRDEPTPRDTRRAASDEEDVVRGLLRICAIGSAIGAPLALSSFLSPSPNLFFAITFFCILALFLCTSPINDVILTAVPGELRASAMALGIFAIHIFGDLWSPPAVGLLADHMAIEIAMMALPFTIAASALLWWPCRRSS